MTHLRAEAIKATVTIREALAALDRAIPETTYQILCPVHQERNPSARVYSDAIYCFTCAKKYDVVTLVMAVKHFTFEQTLDWCEEAFGVKNPAEFVDTILPTVLRHHPAKDFASEITHVERVIKKNKGAMGVDRFNRVCLALDTAVAARSKGTLDDEAFAGVLKTLADFAVTP